MAARLLLNMEFVFMVDVLDFSPRRPLITDVDIENVLCFTNRRDEQEDLLETFAGGILDKLARGADLDVSTHRVQRETVRDRGVIEERLVINGRCVYRRRTGGSHNLKRRSRGDS